MHLNLAVFTLTREVNGGVLAISYAIVTGDQTVVNMLLSIIVTS